MDIQAVQEILLKIAELFVLLFLGYFVVALKVIKKEAAKHFSNLIFYVTLPAFIIIAMSNSVAIPPGDVLKVLAISFGVHAFLVVFAFILPKVLHVPHGYIGLYRFMALFGNVGFVGYPVISAVLGKDALFYAAIFNIFYNMLVYTLGIYFITQDTIAQGEMKINKFLSPALVATVFGLFLFFTGFKLPGFVINITESVGNITTPLSLIVVGSSLYGVKVASLLRNHLIFIYSFIKLIIMPTILALILYILGVEGMIASVSVFITGMPIAANTVILSQEYDGHILEASEAVFVSTLLIIVSIPYLIFITELLF